MALYLCMVAFAPGAGESRLSDFLHDLLLLPAVSVIFAWPGYVIFLVLGVPTLYFLFRYKRADLVIFLLVGAFCTPLPFFVLALLPPHRPGQVKNELDAVPLFALLGLFNGFLTWLIVLGWRWRVSGRAHAYSSR